MLSTIQFDLAPACTFEEYCYIMNIPNTTNVGEIQRKWDSTMHRSETQYRAWHDNWPGWKVHRYDIINHLIKKFNYVNYLEIGVQDAECFKRIDIDHKDLIPLSHMI